MLTVAVTGANGFVGQRFMKYKADRYQLRAVSLREVKPESIDLQGVDAIVHLAGKAHDMSLQDEQVYMDINFTLTKELAKNAMSSGVKQFVYISSVKVYGEGANKPLNENSPCHPEDPYGKSKLKAEQYLQNLQTRDFTVSIVRPPVVYGPGVKGNIIRLLAAVDKGSMLPLGNTRNQRTMVFLDNLIELIHRIIDNGAAGIFVAGDTHPLSTDGLIKLMARKLGKETKLIAVPGLMRKLMSVVKPGLYKRLFGSFVIDTGSTNRRLHFSPPFSTDFGVEQMVKWYKEQQ